MKYVDFNKLCRGVKASTFLDADVAEFLFQQDKKSINFLPAGFASSRKSVSSSRWGFPSLSSSEEFVFSHDLVRAGENQWHIIEKQAKGEGNFGTVRPAKFKITVKKSHGSYSAQVTPVDDVAKTQKCPPGVPYRQFFEQALQEAETQKKHHVAVHAVVPHGNSVITVLENCGTSLDKLLPFTPSHKFSFEFRLAFAARIAGEMLSLKNEGVVHRDLKPANICYREIPNSRDQFHIIFIDFGLAAEVASKRNSEWAGTPCYMAPEVLRGQRSSHASDMYALAAILGEVFGATNILKNKLDALRRRSEDEFIAAPYCFDGLFEGYDAAEIDPNLLQDIRNLLVALQDRDSQRRPTVEHVSKFLLTFPQRMELYRDFNQSWAQMTKEFAQFEAYHQQMNLLKTKHQLVKFSVNLFNENSPLSHAFNRAMLEKRAEIYAALGQIGRFQHLSHNYLAMRLTEANYSPDFEGVDRPYPDLNNIIQMMKQENAKFAKALGSFNTCAHTIVENRKLTPKFAHTNSTGIIKIAKILSSTQSPLEQLQALQQLGRAKTEKGFFNFYSHSTIFGKGRHANVDALYHRLAAINPEKEGQKEDYLVKTQLEEITQFIQGTASFTYK